MRPNFKYKFVINPLAIGNDLMVPPSMSQQCTSVNGVQECLPQYGDLVSKTTILGQNSAPSRCCLCGSGRPTQRRDFDPGSFSTTTVMVRRRAAEGLGLKRTTLQNKMRGLGATNNKDYRSH
jgi:hypothetical protein